MTEMVLVGPKVLSGELGSRAGTGAAGPQKVVKMSVYSGIATKLMGKLHLTKWTSSKILFRNDKDHYILIHQENVIIINIIHQILVYLLS